MTMLEDGLKDEGAEQVRVRDIAELLAETLRLRQKAVRGGDGKRLQRRRRFAPPSP